MDTLKNNEAAELGFGTECYGHEPQGGMADTVYCDGSCSHPLKAPKAKKLTLKEQRIWVEWCLTTDRFVELALLRIYERQTLDEQTSHTTKHDNARGFGAFDAEFGTSMAKGLLKYGHLTPKQIGFARKMCLRYWRQLVECAKAKGKLPETMPEACSAWARKQKDLDEVAGEEVAS